MADTTIKVDSAVRDRLAILAAERGLTIREFVTRLAGQTPTGEELQRRQAEAADYVRKHLRPDFSDEDLVAGEQLWQAVRAGQSTFQAPTAATSRDGQAA